MQLFPWPAYSPDMSHVWDLVGRRLAPAASIDEVLLRIQAIGNCFPQASIQNLFDSMPRRIAAILPRVFSTPNTDFGHLILY
ncbi:transposable element Tcb1 transposase [Trichonephila clavipes]|nr:transposable element Tcb1 transposase [Trichonephila clavipes]